MRRLLTGAVTIGVAMTLTACSSGALKTLNTDLYDGEATTQELSALMDVSCGVMTIYRDDLGMTYREATQELFKYDPSVPRSRTEQIWETAAKVECHQLQDWVDGN